MAVELVGFAVIEDFEDPRRIGGRDHAFDEGGHDLPGGVGVDFAVEGDHAAEGGAGIGVARLAVDLPERFAGTPGRGTGGVHVLHDRAGGGVVEKFDDVERVGDVFQVGLGEAVLAVFEDLHVSDHTGGVRGFVVAGGLMGIGAVAEIVHLAVGASGHDDFRREVPDVFGQIAVAGQFFFHVVSSFEKIENIEKNILLKYITV